VNKGAGTDTDEDTTWLDVTRHNVSPHLQSHDVLDTTAAGHPICYGGSDAAISNLGERAFIAFTNTNNIGVTGRLEGSSPDVLGATTANYYTGSMREIAYTPVGDKVLATSFSTLQVDSRVIVLNASTVAIPMEYSGIVKKVNYTSIQNASMIGPEGIGMQPLYDRDGDAISDLVEARMVDARAAGLTTITLDPVVKNIVNSYPLDTTTMQGATVIHHYSLVGGVLLPDEGMGYRHYLGGSARDLDNWGTLKLIQVIEAVGKEWNMRHPQGPRISVGDLSKPGGGNMPGHASHKMGKDADMRYVRNGYSEGICDLNPPPPDPPCDYNSGLTQELLNLFCKSGVDLIYTDISSRTGLVAPPGCQIDTNYAPDHTNHIHIRIVWP